MNVPGSAEGCRRLWNAVLWCAIRDLCIKDDYIRTQAEFWIGDYPTREFIEICQLADVNSKTMHKAMKAIVDLPRKERIIRIRKCRGILGDDDLHG